MSRGRRRLDAALMERCLADADALCGLAGCVWAGGQRSLLLSQLFCVGPDPAVPRLAALLLARGARLDLRDSMNLTPLHHAAYNATQVSSQCPAPQPLPRGLCRCRVVFGLCAASGGWQPPARVLRP